MFSQAIIRNLLMVTLVGAAVVAQADVFNMPAGRPACSSSPWAIRATRRIRRPARTTAAVGLRLPDGQVRRDGRPVLPVPQRRGQDGHLRPLQQLHGHGLCRPSASPKAAVRATTATRSRAATAKASTVRSSMSPGATRPASATGCKTASRPGPRDRARRKPGRTRSTVRSPTAALMAMTRNAGATYFIPSENEWYKAAYYKGGGTNAGYWLYPTQSNTVPSNVLSATGTNNANFYDSYGLQLHRSDELFDAGGAFAARPGRMARMIWAATSGSGTRRALRFVAWFAWRQLGASSDSWPPPPRLYDPSGEVYCIGFRVASVPEPGSLV